MMNFTDDELYTIVVNGLRLMDGTHPASESDSQAAQDAVRLAPIITALALGALGEEDDREVAR